MAMLLYGREFAGQVLLISLLVFSPGFITAWGLVHDDDVRYWFGATPPLLALGLPCLFLLVFLGHLHATKPRKEGLWCSIIIPTVYFFFLGFWLLFETSRMYDLLTTDLCSSPEMQYLEHHWMQAREFHDSCVQKQVAQLGPELGALPLDKCDGYGDALYIEPGRARAWDYLQHLELNSGCGGWCSPQSRGQHLWVKGWGDAVNCTAVVAGNLRAKLNHSAYQLMVYALVVLTAALVWMYQMKPLFQLQKRQLAKENLYWYVPGGGAFS